ncbi:MULTISPECIES: hypothetical protein [unclassified Microcoleus]|uniref:hypothetical protein n=1 Tax=unclassified Microcoleus TaxID=2642155 RepID=UPI002FCE7CAE
MNLLRKMRDRFAQSTKPAWDTICVTDSGFVSGDASVAWGSLTKIAAFKKDSVTFDDVWFEFSVGPNKVLVCEEQPGFAELLAGIKARFPSVDGWEQKVVQPAFAENYTVLYVGP